MSSVEDRQKYHTEYRRKNRESLRAKNRLIRIKKKEAGFCQTCGWGVPVVPGKTMCEKHLEARKSRRGKKTKTWQKNGMCAHCGQFPAVEGKRSCERCLIYGSRGVRERGAAGKRKIVAYLGGKCQRCGLVTDCMPVYEIHHLSKKNKDFNMKTIQSWSWETILTELNKGVQLLCANCHRIIQHNHEENWANKTLPIGPRSKDRENK